MRSFRYLFGVAVLAASLSPSIGHATVYNFFWTGDPAADNTITSSPDSSLKATGTIDINAAPGAAFTLSDIVSTNISVTGASITPFVFTGWEEAGGTISADGQRATFNAAGNPFFDDLANFFGCDFGGCGATSNQSTDILIANFVGAPVSDRVFYASADEALASMQMTLAAAETPLPAALPLFASGLAGLGFAGWRRKKKAAAPAA